jgi:hypothetical protein
MTESDFNKLLITEIESLKTDLRQNFSELRKEIRNINTELDNRHDNYNNKFLTIKSFEKYLTFLILFITGAYTYVTILFGIH